MLALLVVELGQELVDLHLFGPQRILELGELTVVFLDEGRRVGRLVARGVIGALIGEAEVTLEALELILMARLDAIDVEATLIALADHLGELEVLGLDVLLHPLHPVDRLLCRVGLELHALALAEKVEMLSPKLRVELGERLIFGLPFLDLALELDDELVLGPELGIDVGRDEAELGLERLDAL